MSQIKLNITDNCEVLTGEIHGSIGDALVASLTAEPETIGELESALERFMESESDRTVLGWLKRYQFKNPEDFKNYLDLEPHDAGVLVIDLTGRTVAVDSSYSSYSKDGSIRIKDEFADSVEAEFDLPYRLSDDWKFVYSMPEYEGVADHRREERSKASRVDARAVLYGEPILRFIVEELANAVELQDEDLSAEIHAKWLMMPREDLQRETPRRILLEKEDFIDFDLHSRALQWSFTKKRPPDLERSAAAYKFAGFGTNEVVVYYYLFRFLLDVSFDMLKNTGEMLEADKQIGQLAKIKEEWLKLPNPEFSGRVPADIIESERKRRNLTLSPEECLIDEDCPICIEMSEMFDTPTFWYLDGCNMDYRFEFSFYKTDEEWEMAQRRFEEFDREFEERNKKNEDSSLFDEDHFI